jgi:hypothetical protein
MGRPIRRIAGWAGVDGNPLRRGIDRVERALWATILAAFFAAVPLVVPLAGHVAWANGMTQVKAEQSWQRVDAVLLRHAPDQMYGYNTAGTVWVSGRWRTPGGGVKHGLVPTMVGAPAGTVVPVWINRAGQLTGTRPLTYGGVTSRVVAIEVLAGVALAVAALLAAGLIRWLTNRRRMANWGFEWACIGPRWSTRRLLAELY